MPGITGFIDHMPDGKPYMGLVIEENTVQVKFFLATKAMAPDVVRTLSSQLQNLCNELRRTPDKLVEVNGVVNDAAFRKQAGG